LDLPSPVSDRLAAYLSDRGYAAEALCGSITDCLYDPALQEKLNASDLAIAFLDATQERAEFFLGAVRASFVPTILLTGDVDFVFHSKVPREYQARLVNISEFEELHASIESEIAVFEEEYVDLENQEQVARYAELLFTEGSKTGQYTQGLRNLFVQELHMGDQNINYGQAGSIGRMSTGTLNFYGRAWDQLKTTTDLRALSGELSQLRTALRQKAQSLEDDKAIAAVAEAEAEANQGNGPGVVQKLAAAGTWVLGVAKEIGVKLATEALQKSLGI